jgi:uncharacterized protein (TIRG00374 family)
MNIKKVIVNVVKVSVTGLILYLIFDKFQINIGDITTALKNSSPIWWIASLGTQAAAIFFSIMRWRVLLTPQNLNVPGGHLTRTYLVGRFLGTFTPTGVGLEAYKAYDIARYTKKPTESVSVVLVEKFLTILALSLMVIFSLFAITLPMKFLVAVFGLFGFLLLVTTVLVVKPTLLQLILKFPLPAKGKIEGIINSAVEAFNRYRQNKGALFASVFFGVLVYASLFATFYTNGQALHLPNGPEGRLAAVEINDDVKATLAEMDVEFMEEQSEAGDPTGMAQIFLTPDEEKQLTASGVELQDAVSEETFIRKGLSLGSVMTVGPLTQIATMIPASIAGIGLREGAFAGFLRSSGVWVGPKTILASLMWYFVSITLNIVGAIIFLTRKTNYQASQEEINRVLQGK